MRILIVLLFIASGLFAGELHLNLDSVSKDRQTGSIKTARIEPGVSGLVIRHFTPEHSAIIRNAVVTVYDDKAGVATVSFSAYTGVRQNSLPKGEWSPNAGDEVILAYAYDRALLLAPTRDIYLGITSKLGNIEWMHPDTFATYLSFQGHPTPLQEDFGGFCTDATLGLLFLYLSDSLFTLDCHTLTVLQITRADLNYQDPQLPFYSRVETINANWFGEGSGRLKTYEPYYFKLLVEHNPQSGKLYDYIQSHHSVDQRLLDHFSTKRNP